jgi:hypothetical protein
MSAVGDRAASPLDPRDPARAGIAKPDLPCCGSVILQNYMAPKGDRSMDNPSRSDNISIKFLYERKAAKNFIGPQR